MQGPIFRNIVVSSGIILPGFVHKSGSYLSTIHMLPLTQYFIWQNTHMEKT